LLFGSATYLTANILNAAIPFALLPILTRYLSPAQYGQVAMFQTLVGALSAFVGLNVVGAAARKFDDNASSIELRQYLGACLQIVLISAAAVFAVILWWRSELAGWLGLSPEWILWAVFVSAALMIINLRLGQWQVRQRAGAYGTFQVLQSAANLLLSLGFVVVLQRGAEGRLAAQAWTAAVFLLVALALLKRDGLLVITGWAPKDWADALRFGVPLIPHIAGLFLLSSVDRIVINARLGLAEAGTYMVAAQLAGALGLVMDAANKAYVPWLFEHLKRDVAGEKCDIVRLTYVVFALLLLVSGMAFLAGPWLVTTIAGQTYRQAGRLFGWLVLGQAFNGMYLMVTNYVFFSKRTGLLSVASISCGLFNVALLVVLVRHLGITGAAIAFAVSMGARFAVTWRVAQSRHYMPWFSFHRQHIYAP
jgi:O-antigen/teichoic acid export membrane protein